jgi:hypothetical protein
MVITDKFVFVHQPKTGGTFVRQVIDTIAKAELAEFPMGRLRRAGLLPRRYRYCDTAEYHDTCRDVPAEHRHKKIVSAVRDPFDFYVSFYHYGWWVAHPEDSYRDFEAVRRAFPSFPDLSFEEFLGLANGFFVDFDMIGDPGQHHRSGYYSTQFLHYFFKAPADAYQRIDSAYLAERAWCDDMFTVEFLRTSTLNRDLHRFLAREGYPRRYIDGVLRKTPVRPEEHHKPRPSASFKNYYTPATYDLVRAKERLLFAIFPDLGGKQTYEEWMADHRARGATVRDDGTISGHDSGAH